MIVEKVGSGEPEICVIGGIHGDEPCTFTSVEDILLENIEYKKPVKYIIANEKAREYNTRYVDTDLNRSFPGNKNSENHEERLAAQIMEEIKNMKSVLSLHSTRSSSIPFAITSNMDKNKLDILQRLPLTKAVIERDLVKGDLINECENCIEIECGYQNSEQAKMNADYFIKFFLNYHGAIESTIPNVTTRLDIFKAEESVPKDKDYRFVGQNFTEIKEGEIYAVSDEGILTAQYDFYPVLMSTTGYEDILGYKGVKMTSI